MRLSKHGLSPGEVPIPQGRWASKKEGAGQIRIFALALTIYFKQGMVRPRQDWLMTILSLIRLEVTEPIRYGSVETIVIHPGILLFLFERRQPIRCLPVSLSYWWVRSLS